MMIEQRKIGGGILARNTALSLISQIVPMLVGVVTARYVIHGLGNEAFGILSIVWVLLTYLALLDLGTGRATTKFVSESLGRDESDPIPNLIWTSLGIQVLFGVVLSLVLGLLTSILVNHILKIPQVLAGQAKLSFYFLSFSLPFVLATNALRGALEATQRFDLINYVKLPANLCVFLLPAIGLLFGLRLPGIVFILALSRLFAFLGYLLLCMRVFPGLKRRFVFDSGRMGSLLSYGGWVMISNTISPVLTSVDRFLIGAIISIGAVTFYSVPFDFVTRLSIFPSSLGATLFPAFSYLDVGGSKEGMEEYYMRSIKALLLVLGTVALLIFIFSREILNLWLGPEFATNSHLVLRVLVVGVLINALSFVPYSLLQAVGRPDLTAKFHLLEVPIYALMLWFFVVRMGVIGAALAWTFRLTLDGILVFAAVRRLRLISISQYSMSSVLKSVIALSLLGITLTLTYFVAIGPFVRMSLALMVTAIFSIALWRFVLDNRDRSFIAAAVPRLTSHSGT
jgi:O-antigen/teichoic acid export membrane protein